MQVWSVRPSHLLAACGAVVAGAVLLLWAPWSAQARSTTLPQSSSVAMNCAPGQQALVRQHVVNGELSVSVDCASGAAGAFERTAFVDQNGGFAPQPVSVAPAVYRTAYPAPAPTYTPRAARAPRPVTRSVDTPRRDWKREALIIGGSAGAAAGIGGLVGGKKGALIGAAIGGGGAALYRAAKQ